MKKALLAVLPVVVLSLAAVAAADWRQAGVTAKGDKVSVSSMKVTKAVRTAWVRVQFQQPVKLPQGGPFVELRAKARFNCSAGAATTSEVWFYSRDRSGKVVVSKKASRDDQFGKDAEGGFGAIAQKYVCQQK